MADLSILAGATSRSINIDLYVLSTGAPQTGLVFNSLGLTAAYSFTGANATATSITLATQTVNGAWSSGGFVEIDATKQPGLYRFDIPNAALVSAKGQDVVITFTGFSGMRVDHTKIELTGWDNQLVPGAAGGMFIAGTNVATTINGTAASGATPAVAALTLTGGAASTTGGGVASSGLIITGGAGAASTNGAVAGAKITGGGTNTVASAATGLVITGTSNGHGLDCESGTGTTFGISGINATSNGGGGNGGHGMLATGSLNGNGLYGVGGVTSGVGAQFDGGATSGQGIFIRAQGGTSQGVRIVANGTGDGVAITGGLATSGISGGAGLKITGGGSTTAAGATAGVGLVITGGAGAASTNGAASGATITGGGTNTVSSVADGLKLTGTSNGSGLNCILAGTGASITASTITGTLATVTTATNLTNSPTSGDFTATMKTSIGTAVAASAVASVTNPVTVGTIASTATNIKKNTALAGFEFLMTDSTNHLPKTGLSVTATRSLDGAAFAGCSNAVTEVASGIYKIDLATTDMNANTITLRFTSTGADDSLITVVTQP